MHCKFQRWSRLGRVLAALFLITTACSAQEQPANEEYRVYEAVLKLMDTIPKQDPHVAIYDRTLSSKCAAEAGRKDGSRKGKVSACVLVTR